MPNLPTVNVTQAQADRILAVFGDIPSYKRWLVQAIKEYVVQQEILRMEEISYTEAQAAEAARLKKLSDLRNSLDVPNP